MLLQKAKNRGAFVCSKWLNQTPCSKTRPCEAQTGIQNAVKRYLKVKILPCALILMTSTVPYLYGPAAGIVSVSPGSAGVAAGWQVEPVCSEAAVLTGFCSRAGVLVVLAECWRDDPSWPGGTESVMTWSLGLVKRKTKSVIKFLPNSWHINDVIKLYNV